MIGAIVVSVWAEKWKIYSLEERWELKRIKQKEVVSKSWFTHIPWPRASLLQIGSASASA